MKNLLINIFSFIFLFLGILLILIPLIIYKLIPLSINLGVFSYIGFLFITTGFLGFIFSIINFLEEGQVFLMPFKFPIKLIESGLYRYCRNPICVLSILIILGEALFLCSLSLIIYGLIFFFLWRFLIIKYEEPSLKKKFNKKYLNYLNKVPRFIPKIKTK